MTNIVLICVVPLLIALCFFQCHIHEKPMISVIGPYSTSNPQPQSDPKPTRMPRCNRFSPNSFQDLMKSSARQHHIEPKPIKMRRRNAIGPHSFDAFQIMAFAARYEEEERLTKRSRTDHPMKATTTSMTAATPYVASSA